MQEPAYVFFPIMDEEPFETTEYQIDDGDPGVSELGGSPSDTQRKGDESKVKDMQIFVDRPKSLTESFRRREHNVPPLILMIPPKEADENCSTPFQFHRQAPGRISTSPTLRRLRKNTAGHFMPLQDFFDVTRFPNHKEQSVLASSAGHFCENLPWSPKYTASLSPSSCVSPLVLYPKEEVSSMHQVLEENINNDAALADPALHSNYTDDEKCPMSSEDNHTATSTAASPISGADNVNHCTEMKECRQSRGKWKETGIGHLVAAISPRPSLRRRSAADGPTAAPPLDTQPPPPSQRLFERRRSSVVLSLPGLEVFPGDLLVSDGASDYLYHSTLLPNADAKKLKWPFSKKGSQIKGKQKQISDLENCLSTIKISDFDEYEFYNIKDKTWNEFFSLQSMENNDIPDQSNRKRQESVWELFTSECTYFLDHLLVLKMVFLNALKCLQSNEHLLDVDLWRLFANLEVLSQESLNFATGLFNTIKDSELGIATSVSFSLADLLTKYFEENFCLSHQIYCLNYTSAVVYLESLRQRDDFAVYLKWCEQNEHCKRLHLPDLLVAPLHRLTRYPLILNNMWKRSTDANEKISIYSMKEKVENSIRDLEGKVKWLDKSQKFKQLQEVIVWPPLWNRDKRFFFPEGLKHHFKESNVENILSSPNRHLLHEGKLILTESVRLLDVYLFLFDDFLLITKTKRNRRKSTNLEMNLMYSSLHPELQSVMKEGGYCKVVDQPIPLDRLILKSIDQFHGTVYGMRNSFLIQQENRYQQCIAAFVLQAQTESAKKSWMSQIETAISSYTETYETKKASTLCQPTESAEI
ncbi:pleckstrin homology domain-containing family G member 7 [Ascaphus truei]|uniref:pleckstrin homology domain-containing family G member 7 n=1 Tax=Ascaphus truei TaxID=8439 RepID=UPI003F5A3969